MSILRFLAALEDSGRPRVPAAPDLRAPDAEELARLDARLRALAERVRADLAHDPPPVSLPVARWGLRTVYVAAQALVHRSVPAEAVDALLDVPAPEGPSPSAALSADLTFCVLPELLRLARALGRGGGPAGSSDDDPLRRALERLAERWPLSSVGARVPAEPGALDVVLDHPSLRALYVDRLLAARDVSRLGEPRVDAAVREALGGRPELCAEVARALGRGGGPKDREPRVSAGDPRGPAGSSVEAVA